jgi:hypothetical protein
MKKNLFDLDLQYFAEGEDAGVTEVETIAGSQEDETTEANEVETGETTGDAEPEPQTAEENARYAAIRRRAEEEAKRKYESELGSLNQQISAMCQGITHPTTGQPITNVRDYVEALQIQQRQAREQELKEKGIDPSMIDRMIESNPVVMQAQQVIEQNKMTQAEQALQNDLAEISKYDPSIKGIKDLSALPNFPEILSRVERGASLIDAYKMVNFDTFMQHTNEAARQQAINQMRGKEHLTTQKGVAEAEDYVEVPAEIMSRWKNEGKTEKQIRDLYKSVASKLHLN